MLEEKPNVAFQHDRTSSYVEDEVTTFMNRQFPERYFGLGGTSSCSLLLSVLNPPPPILHRFCSDVGVMIDGVVKVSRIGGQGTRAQIY